MSETKSCPYCAEEILAVARKCRHCGEFLDARLAAARAAEGGPDLGQDPAMRMLLPVGRSAWAVLAGYLGLLAPLLVFAPLALATGIAAVVEIQRRPEKHGMGRAFFGIVMGALFTVGLLIVIMESL